MYIEQQCDSWLTVREAEARSDVILRGSGRGPGCQKQQGGRDKESAHDSERPHVSSGWTLEMVGKCGQKRESMAYTALLSGLCGIHEDFSFSSTFSRSLSFSARFIFLPPLPPFFFPPRGREQSQNRRAVLCLCKQSPLEFFLCCAE